MKKTLFLGAVLAVSLMFAFTAVAQDGEVSCTKCDTKSCSIPTIGCSSVQESPCPAQPLPWECFVFPICDCPDTATHFVAGAKIGVRMHILTEGVYWAENATELAFNAYESKTDACRGENNINIAGDDPNAPYSFTDILYFPEETCVTDEADLPVGHGECSWSEDDYPKLKSLSTNRRNQEAFLTIPEGWDGFSYWSIQIPNIKIDINEVLAAGLAGEKVRIRIEIVKAGEGGLCQGDCQILCECVVEVATLCGEDYASTGCIYFPYVLTQMKEMESSWSCGIALSNLGDVAAEDMEATFTLTDKNGDSFSYTKDDFTTTNWANVMDALMGQFDGTPAPGQAWLKVVTNFPVDGYQFVTDGTFGGSTLARPCYQKYFE